MRKKGQAGFLSEPSPDFWGEAAALAERREQPWLIWNLGQWGSNRVALCIFTQPLVFKLQILLYSEIKSIYIAPAIDCLLKLVASQLLLSMDYIWQFAGSIDLWTNSWTVHRAPNAWSWTLRAWESPLLWKTLLAFLPISSNPASPFLMPTSSHFGSFSSLSLIKILAHKQNCRWSWVWWL